MILRAMAREREKRFADAASMLRALDRAVAARGLDLSGHQSQPVTERLINYADLILTMTHSHRDAIVQHIPSARNRTHLLCRDESDVSDPIGGSAELYEQCAEQIDRELAAWLDVLDLDSLVPKSTDEEEA